MYRLSKDADLSFLRGVELQQVCVGCNEVILNFDQDVRITILSSFAVAYKRGVPPIRYDDASGGSAFLALLHGTVSRGEPTDEGGLLITFRSGASITVFDDSDQYESFWLSNGNKQIIV